MRNNKVEKKSKVDRAPKEIFLRGAFFLKMKKPRGSTTRGNAAMMSAGAWAEPIPDYAFMIQKIK